MKYRIWPNKKKRIKIRMISKFKSSLLSIIFLISIIFIIHSYNSVVFLQHLWKESKRDRRIKKMKIPLKILINYPDPGWETKLLEKNSASSLLRVTQLPWNCLKIKLKELKQISESSKWKNDLSIILRVIPIAFLRK